MKDVKTDNEKTASELYESSIFVSDETLIQKYYEDFEKIQNDKVYQGYSI